MSNLQERDEQVAQERSWWPRAGSARDTRQKFKKQAQFCQLSKPKVGVRVGSTYRGCIPGQEDHSWGYHVIIFSLWGKEGKKSSLAVVLGPVT